MPDQDNQKPANPGSGNNNDTNTGLPEVPPPPQPTTPSSPPSMKQATDSPTPTGSEDSNSSPPPSTQKPNTLGTTNNDQTDNFQINTPPTENQPDASSVVTGSSDNGYGSNMKKIAMSLLGVLVLSLSVGAGVYLVKQNQDIGEEADRISPIPCQIEPQQGRLIFQFQEEVLYSNHIKRNGKRVDRTSKIPAAIAAGDYTVTLSSYDDHIAKPDQTQDKERYFVQFVDENENEITLTNSMSDLPENQDFLTETVNSSLTIPQNAAGFIAWHSDNPDDSSPNSIVPVCIALDPVEEFSASCSEVTAYDNDWNPLTMQQLSQLSAGETVKFVVSGTSSNGTIDKARFRVNSSDWQESSDLKPGEANTFYINYTIPDGVTSFTVNGQVHLVETDNWY